MFRPRFSALMAAALFALATAACSDDTDSPSGPTPPPAVGTIVIRNDANGPIDRVNFNGCDNPDWGENRLNAGETIEPGATRSWTTEPGCYDIRARVGTLNGIWWDRDLAAGGSLNLALNLSQSNVGPVSLSNSPIKVR